MAGFNYGEYVKIEMPDTITHYKIEGYYLTELPDRFRGNRALEAMAPGAMTKYALDQTRAQIAGLHAFLRQIPYDNINITEQPDFNFGQSWPNLVYLPISAYMDSTQRWMLFGHIDKKFTGFVQEVTPHEVAHQWWGHAVGWASYHDQWLSEGFAEFSAGLFLQQAMGEKWQKDYIEFWDRLRRRILEKNNFGVAPNDAGPIWMGMRHVTSHFERVPERNLPEGRLYPANAALPDVERRHAGQGIHGDDARLCREPSRPPGQHGIIQGHRGEAHDEDHGPAKERPPGLVLQRMGLWHPGSAVQVRIPDDPAADGKVNLHMTITESDVDEHFAMLVPIFADFGKGMVRIGQVGLVGNSTHTTDAVLPSMPKKVALNAYKDILER